ncbi:hypothetical protein CDD83_10112 [Cordyceps sp. RAO-2017]|nr:hypothetical protein CDD83_10112 [Cordyceps sp. RAO-2017]
MLETDQVLAGAGGSRVAGKGDGTVGLESGSGAAATAGPRISGPTPATPQDDQPPAPPASGAPPPAARDERRTPAELEPQFLGSGKPGPFVGPRWGRERRDAIPSPPRSQRQRPLISVRPAGCRPDGWAALLVVLSPLPRSFCASIPLSHSSLADV